MPIPDADQYVFVVFTWGADSEHHETFGPYETREDNAHLQDVEVLARWWKDEHPERENVAVHLFATRRVPPEETG